jgi:hypothetical protein
MDSSQEFYEEFLVRQLHELQVRLVSEYRRQAALALQSAQPKEGLGASSSSQSPGPGASKFASAPSSPLQSTRIVVGGKKATEASKSEVAGVSVTSEAWGGGPESFSGEAPKFDITASCDTSNTELIAEAIEKELGVERRHGSKDAWATRSDTNLEQDIEELCVDDGDGDRLPGAMDRGAPPPVKKRILQAPTLTLTNFDAGEDDEVIVAGPLTEPAPKKASMLSVNTVDQERVRNFSISSEASAGEPVQKTSSRVTWQMEDDPGDDSVAATKFRPGQDDDSDDSDGSPGKRKKTVNTGFGPPTPAASAKKTNLSRAASGINGDHFEVREAWTNSGHSIRKRAYSIRSKSLFMEEPPKPISVTSEDGSSQRENQMDQLMLMSNRSTMRKIMIHPSAMKHLVWDLFGLVLLAYDCIFIPLLVFDFRDRQWKTAIGWIIRMYWTVNVFKTFCTGYLMDDGQVEMRPGRVARRYVMTWLPMDLSVVLTDWGEVALTGFQGGGFQRFGSALRGLRMFRTVRLIRLIKAPEITGFLNDSIRSEHIMLIMSIFKVIMIMLGVAHISACLWYGIGRPDWWGRTGNAKTWIVVNEIRELPEAQRYLASFHWSLAQFAGELMYMPENGAERVFMVIVLFFGFILSAWFISTITTSMTQLQMITSEQSTQFNSLRRYLMDANISRPLVVRVQRNAQHALEEKKRSVDESSVKLLEIISNPLLVELHFEIHGSVLLTHPFFQQLLSDQSRWHPKGLSFGCQQGPRAPGRRTVSRIGSADTQKNVLRDQGRTPVRFRSQGDHGGPRRVALRGCAVDCVDALRHVPGQEVHATTRGGG